MTVRSWLYEVLISYPPLAVLVGDRVFQGEGLTSAQLEKPYLVYRMGNETDEGLGGEQITDPHPSRQFLQIYVHDEPGDYDQIDAILRAVKGAFREAGGSPENGIIAVRYLETARDQDDPTLGTIFRYARYQFVQFS